MRKLVEKNVVQILDELAAEDMGHVETIMDLDMGYWNADKGPKMSRKVYKKIVKDCSDEELLELFGHIAFVC